MIIAELHGKLDSSASSYEISEDILTSNVFQLIRYLPASEVIIPFLNEALHAGKTGISIDPSLKWQVDYIFWPRGITMNREPDLMIQLESDENSYCFIIEAKYYSGPSDRETDESDDGQISGSQLGDQFIDMIKGVYAYNQETVKLAAPVKNRFLLYLTKHTVKPEEVIAVAVKQFKSYRKKYKEIDIEKNLLWANWTAIWKVLKDIEFKDYPYSIIQEDLVALLEKKGFKYFSGFNLFNWHKSEYSFWVNEWFNLQYNKMYNKEGGFFYK